jgi:hypothetical protein
VELSAQPTRQIEGSGTVAIDSTAFSTTVRGSYCDQVDTPGRKRRFVKMHIIVGTLTLAILAIAVTDEGGADPLR